MAFPRPDTREPSQVCSGSYCPSHRASPKRSDSLSKTCLNSDPDLTSVYKLLGAIVFPIERWHIKCYQAHVNPKSEKTKSSPVKAKPPRCAATSSTCYDCKPTLRNSTLCKCLSPPPFHFDLKSRASYYASRWGKTPSLHCS